jgi:excinuclease ABC subunit B
VGRAARNVSGTAIFYADRVTGSMQRAMEETDRRRVIQLAHNAEHGITPRTVIKNADQVRFTTRVADARMEKPQVRRVSERPATFASEIDLVARIEEVEAAMRTAAQELDFEAAAQLRDELFELKTRLGSGGGASRVRAGAAPGGGR